MALALSDVDLKTITARSAAVVTAEYMGTGKDESYRFKVIQVLWRDARMVVHPPTGTLTVASGFVALDDTYMLPTLLKYRFGKKELKVGEQLIVFLALDQKTGTWITTAEHAWEPIQNLEAVKGELRTQGR